MSIATLTDLESELLTVIRTLPQFAKKAFSAYSLADLEAKAEWQAADMPIVGVSYNGAVPTGNQAVPVSRSTHAAIFGSFQFIVILAVQYGAQGQDTSQGQDGTKQDAMVLLNEMRQKLVGYKKVNMRPWRWLGERPEPEASGDGIIFYSQLWETDVSTVGTSVTT